MSASRSARRQNETPAATATRTSVAATSPRVTWMELLIPVGLSTSIHDPVHEAQPRPRLVDRADLVVDEPALERNLADDVLGQVGLDVRRALRPRDPESAVGEDRPFERVEAALQRRAGREEADDDVELAPRAASGRHAVGQLPERGVEIRGR